MSDEIKDDDKIYLQVCKNCKTVQAVFQLKKDEPYPISEEWMDECFMGEHVNQFYQDQKFSIQYIGYCSVECEIDDKGWLI